jgi:hypothetical protein
MDQTHARAACTIAATTSKNGNGGLFFSRLIGSPVSPRLLDTQFDIRAPCLVGRDEGFCLKGTYLCDIQYMSKHCVEDATLDSRA